MVIPSQAQIVCKGCGLFAEPSRTYRLWCDPCAKRKQVDYQRAFRDRQKATPRIVTCKGCGIEFDASRSGRTWRCQPCVNAYQIDLAHKDRERHAGYSRAYRAGLGNEYRDRMTRRRAEAIAKMSPEELAAFRRCEADKSKRLNDILREEVFQAYGGYRCTCCGEAEPKFLSIDHIGNDGAEMRRAKVHSRGDTQFYQWLRKNSYPAGFQVLCMNCNLGKHRNGGVCPHQSLKV